MPPAEAERRLRSRWKPASLLYVELDEGNGGVVMNISETGVAIHAAQTVVQSSVSNVRFKLPPSREKIVACGQIAWKGDTRKELGVRFLDLPPAAQLAIRKWIQADSVPRRLPEQARPFLLSKVRPISPPVTAAPASAEARPQAPSSDPAPARYPISTAMAFALREAKEAERVATPPVSLATSATVQAFPAAPTRTAHPEAASKSEDQHAPAPAGATRLQKPPGPPKPAASGRPLVGTVLPLTYETQVSNESALTAEVHPSQSRPAWRRRIVIGAGLTLISFLLGFVAGGQDSSAMVEMLSAEWTRSWNASVEYFSANIEAVATKTTAPKAASSTASEAPIEMVAKTDSSTVVVDAAPSPPARQVEPRSLPGVRGPATPMSSTKRNRNELSSGPPVSKASSEASPPVETKALPLVPGPAPATPESQLAKATVAGPEQNSDQQPSAGPSTTGVSGTVVVHSRLRTIRVPSDLRNLNAQTGDGLQVGELISGEPPAYPQDALREGMEGTVSLRAVIGKDGTVASAELVKGPALLASPSLAVVRGWRYEPTLLAGQPVEWEEDITLVFRLQKPSTPAN